MPLNIKPGGVVDTNIREYGDGDTVTIKSLPVDRTRYRLAVIAVNEGGYHSTRVDLLDLIAWVKANAPELLDQA